MIFDSPCKSVEYKMWWICMEQKVTRRQKYPRKDKHNSKQFMSWLAEDEKSK